MCDRSSSSIMQQNTGWGFPQRIVSGVRWMTTLYRTQYLWEGINKLSCMA